MSQFVMGDPTSNATAPTTPPLLSMERVPYSDAMAPSVSNLVVCVHNWRVMRTGLAAIARSLPEWMAFYCTHCLFTLWRPFPAPPEEVLPKKPVDIYERPETHEPSV